MSPDSRSSVGTISMGRRDVFWQVLETAILVAAFIVTFWFAFDLGLTAGWSEGWKDRKRYEKEELWR